MEIRNYILLILIITLFSCKGRKVDQNIGQNKELITTQDSSNSALKFAEKVFGDCLRVHSYERSVSGYQDVQMLFETDELLEYTAFSNELYQKETPSNNYEGCILFVATYKNLKSAEYAFKHLKSNSEIRLSEIEGMAGLVVEQVYVLERIRKSGGMFTQKGKYVFYLVETCGEPPVEANWNDYENLFIESITEKNEEIQVINADCEMDRLIVQNIKASR